MSALGAEDVDVVRDGIDICFSSANKCLHSVSGVSFLCVAPEVWPRISGIKPRVYYLDLIRHRQYLQELRQTPFTPAVSSFFALETALDELAEQGGVPARRELYRRRNVRIRRLFTDLGFESFSNTGRESHDDLDAAAARRPDRRRALRRDEGARLHRLPRQGRRSPIATSRSRTWASCPTRPSTRSWRR